MDGSPPGSSVPGILPAGINPPGDLLDPGIEPWSFVSPVLAGGFFTTSTTWEVGGDINCLSNLFYHHK